MSYKLVSPPFDLNFRDAPKKVLEAYFAWFQGVIPERIVELTTAINATPNFETWDADFTPESLLGLGTWFATQVEARPRSEAEMQGIKEGLKFPIEISTEELTNKTFSLAMDVGIYLSQVFLKNNPTLYWGQILKNKRYAHYGRPVLLGFGVVPLEPVHISVTVAYGFHRKTRGNDDLCELYDYWLGMISPSNN